MAQQQRQILKADYAVLQAMTRLQLLHTAQSMGYDPYISTESMEREIVTQYIVGKLG